MNSLKYIIIPFFIAILSQIVKTIIETIKYKKINIFNKNYWKQIFFMLLLISDGPLAQLVRASGS